MSVLLRLAIRLYWLLPESRRRRCLFRESCSRHVYRLAGEKGFRAALAAFRVRSRQCRPGYAFYRSEAGDEHVIFADHSVCPRSETTV